VSEYTNMRFHWLHELRQLRARARYGQRTDKERRQAQQKLVTLRKNRALKEKTT
jgi:hypothetical protein